MDDKLEKFFETMDFDIHNPIDGHQERFLRKLKTKKKKNIPYKWIGFVASILFLIGFAFGSSYQQQQYLDLKDIDPKMAEAQDFFQITIKNSLTEIDEYKNDKNESKITNTLNRLNDLEQQFKIIQRELKTSENKKSKILKMIQNYQQRIEILENLLKELKHQEKIITLKKIENEIS